MEPDWDQARVLLAVARTGQLLGAGRRLGLNHATISRRIAQLEEALGARLLDRHTHGVTLTAAGETLVAAAERMEAAILQAQAQLSAGTPEITGPVRIGAPDGFGTYFLAAELGRLTRRHPGLVIELVPLPRTFSLSRREADVVVTLDRPVRERLIVRRLTDYALGVYASAGYLAERGTPAGPGDLARHVLVTGVDDFLYSHALDYAADLRAATPTRFECAGVAGQIEAVRAGVGLAVLHVYAARQFPELVPVLPSVRFTRTYWLVAHPDTHRDRRVAAVMSALAASVAAARTRFLPE